MFEVAGTCAAESRGFAKSAWREILFKMRKENYVEETKLRGIGHLSSRLERVCLVSTEN